MSAPAFTSLKMAIRRMTPLLFPPPPLDEAPMGTWVGTNPETWLPRLNACLLTAYLEEAPMRAHVAAFLKKPFDVPRLLEVVEDVLG